MIDNITLIVDSSVRIAATLLFAALGELVAERAGTLNISVEGAMLSSAFAAAYGSHATGSAYYGFLIGVVVGIAVSGVQANLSHRVRVNQFVTGLVLNLLAIGVTSFLLAEVKMAPVQFARVRIPGLASIPIIGDALFEQRAPFFLLYGLIPLVWWVLKRSRWGLELDAVGENPAAADANGIPVDVRRRQAIYFGGLLAGISGAYLSVGLIGAFTPNMTALRGFIAIAAVIFGGWTLWGTVAGTLLFGGAEALRVSLPALGLTITPQVLIALPYLAAIAAIALLSQRRRQPAALGQTFRRGFS